jgi:hypothetical protein
MDLIVKTIKEPEVYRYWKKNCFKHAGRVSYGKYKNFDIFQKTGFLENSCNINEIYKIFYHCIHMSIDEDVNEYINTLDAIQNNIQECDE